MRIGGNTGHLSDSVESVMRIGGIIIGQSTDSGESVMRIGGNTGPLTDSGESVIESVGTLVNRLIRESRSLESVGTPVT